MLPLMQSDVLYLPPRVLESRNQRCQQRRLATAVWTDDFPKPVICRKQLDQCLY